jgi:hypothetical protein
MDSMVYCFGDEIINKPPNAPTIDGPTGGKIDTEYNYIFRSVDLNDDDVFYYIKWGDGHVETWDGPHTSGEDINFTHTYSREGTFIIKAKAKDIFNEESEWSEFSVTIPREKVVNNYILSRLQSHPNFFTIILLYIYNFKSTI